MTPCRLRPALPLFQGESSSQLSPLQSGRAGLSRQGVAQTIDNAECTRMFQIGEWRLRNADFAGDVSWSRTRSTSSDGGSMSMFWNEVERRLTPRWTPGSLKCCNLLNLLTSILWQSLCS